MNKKSGRTPPKSQAAEDLRELFEDELKDIYWAEKALTKALPKMAKNATVKELAGAINDHLEVTRNQVQRLGQVFEAVGKKAQAKKCEAMDGLLKKVMRSSKVPSPDRFAMPVSFRPARK